MSKLGVKWAESCDGHQLEIRERDTPRDWWLWSVAKRGREIASGLEPTLKRAQIIARLVAQRRRVWK